MASAGGRLSRLWFLHAGVVVISSIVMSCGSFEGDARHSVLWRTCVLVIKELLVAARDVELNLNTNLKNC